MQLDYSDQGATGYDGQPATTYPGGIVTGIPTAAMQPGKICTFDTGAGTVSKSMRAPAAAVDVVRPAIFGLVLRQEAREAGSDYPIGYAVPVMRKGQAYVRVEDAVVKGTYAYVRHVAAGAEVLGSLRSDADGGGPDATICTGIRFLETVGAGEICLVEIDL